jgi:hypothetical protein
LPIIARQAFSNNRKYDPYSFKSQKSAEIPKENTLKTEQEDHERMLKLYQELKSSRIMKKRVLKLINDRKRIQTNLQNQAGITQTMKINSNLALNFLLNTTGTKG